MIGFTCLLIFLSAICNAVVEILRHDWEAFRRRFPKCNVNFWYPSFCWRNKWKGGDPANGPRFTGSTTYLVWLTDGYHLLRSVEKLLLVIAICLPVQAGSFENMVMLFVFLILSWSVGFNVTYHYYFKHSL